MAGFDPPSFFTASLRQVFQVARAYRAKSRNEWMQTLMIYTKVHNVNVTKRSDTLDPSKMIQDMFGGGIIKQDPVSLLDKFRLLALETKGKDYRG